jgi:hypothetical protein
VDSSSKNKLIRGGNGIFTRCSYANCLWISTALVLDCSPLLDCLQYQPPPPNGRSRRARTDRWGQGRSRRVEWARGPKPAAALRDRDVLLAIGRCHSRSRCATAAARWIGTRVTIWEPRRCSRLWSVRTQLAAWALITLAASAATSWFVAFWSN